MLVVRGSELIRKRMVNYPTISLVCLVSWRDLFNSTKKEKWRPPQARSGLRTVLRNRVSHHGRYPFRPWFDQDGQWYREFTVRVPRVAISTGFERRGRCACLLRILRTPRCRPWTPTRTFLHG